jgi:diacylglycerol kinase family enzyme
LSDHLSIFNADPKINHTQKKEDILMMEQQYYSLAQVALVVTWDYRHRHHQQQRHVKLHITDTKLHFYRVENDIESSKPVDTIDFTQIYAVFRYGKAEQFKLCLLPPPNSKFDPHECFLTLCCENVSTCEKWITALSSKCVFWTDRKPAKVLVFVNPTAEARAEKLYNKVVEPMLKMASDYMPHLFSFTHVESQFKNHAFKLLNDGELIYDYNVILAIGGDGLVHEVVNGILSRPDANSVKENIALAVIPAGGSNSLATTLNSGRYPIPSKLDARSPCLQYQQLCALFAAMVIKGQSQRIDILETYQNNQRKFSATTTLSGLFSDIVNFAANYRQKRLVGDKSYIFAALKAIKQKQYFGAKISYCGETNEEGPLLDKYFPEHKTAASNPSDTELVPVNVYEGEFLFIATVNNDHIDRYVALEKKSTSQVLHSGEVEMLWMRRDSEHKDVSSACLMRTFVSTARKGFLDPNNHLKINRVRTRAFKIEFTDFDHLPSSVLIDGETADPTYALYGEVHKDWLKILFIN